MNNSGLPARIKIPFASTGSKNPIPEVSTGSMVTDGLAAMDTGFPSTTLTPRSAGGVPPHGEDMNGILNAITSKLQASDAGARYPFDATFATSIGGYPNGAVVMSSDLAGEWLNTIDANSTNPEGTATISTGWVPLNFAGASAVSISTANITMSCLAAARPVLILSGALTGNRFLYIPNWAKHWTIINNCTGSYSVIVSTISGVDTASIPSSTIANIYCDGNLNVTKLQSTQLASTTQAGIVQLNDTLTSTSTTEALTAAMGKKLQDEKAAISLFYSSLGVNAGYQKIAGGFIIQWGYIASINIDTFAVTFPIAFPNQCVIAAVDVYNGAIDQYLRAVPTQTTTGMSGTLAGTGNLPVKWFAMGY